MRRFKYANYALLIFFAAFIWGYSLVDAFAPAREYSELENRYLKQAPRFSVRALINNAYTLGVEEFTNDQFILRDSWITLKSLCETALGKIENNGIIYGKDGYMFERRLSVDEEQLQKNLDSLLEFRNKHTDENISIMLVPTADMILTDKLPRGLNNIDQKPLIDDIYKKAEAAGIGAVDVYTALSNDYLENRLLTRLSSVRDDGLEMSPVHPVYYRTDHHWTTDSAYVAYRSYLEGLNPPPTDIEKETLFNKSSAGYAPDFYGTYYSKAKLFSAEPDTITWYDIPVKSVSINGEAVDGLYDKEKFEVRDKYAAFLHGNNGVTVIESDCNLNRTEGEKSKILVFKDSFGNSFAPFLAYSFDEITVVDLRYFNEVEKLVTEGGFNNILILYSFPTFAQETSIVNLKF